MKIIKILRRVLSLALLIVFTSETVFAQTPQLSFAPNAGANPEIKNFSQSLLLPKEFGKLEISGENKPALYLIQDPHGHYEGQKNIQHILEFLYRKKELRQILLEGGAGRQDLELLRFFKQPEFNLKAVRLLAHEAEAGGAELFYAENPEAGKKVPMTGIEDPAVYLENIRLYSRVQAQKEESEKYLVESFERLGTEASHFNPALLKFFKQWLNFETGKSDLESFLRELQENARETLKADLKDPRQQLSWPMLVRYVELKNRESRLDEKKAAEEKEKLLQWAAKNKIAKNLVSQLKAGSFAEGRRAFWENFYGAASAKGFKFQDYPALSLAEGFYVLREEMESRDFYNETEKIRDEILRNLSKTSEEKQLTENARDFLLLRKILRLEITPSELQQIKSRLIGSGFIHKLPASIAGIYRDSLSFYEIAEKRDNIMLGEILKQRPDSKRPAAVILGGFHTPGLTRELQTRGLSYALVTPHLPEIEDSGKYIAAMTGEKAKPDFQYFAARVAAWTTPQSQWNGKFPLALSARRAGFRKLIEAEGLKQGAALNPLSSRAEIRTAAKDEILDSVIIALNPIRESDPASKILTRFKENLELGRPLSQEFAEKIRTEVLARREGWMGAIRDELEELKGNKERNKGSVETTEARLETYEIAYRRIENYLQKKDVYAQVLSTEFDSIRVNEIEGLRGGLYNSVRQTFAAEGVRTIHDIIGYIIQRPEKFGRIISESGRTRVVESVIEVVSGQRLTVMRALNQTAAREIPLDALDFYVFEIGGNHISLQVAALRRAGVSNFDDLERLIQNEKTFAAIIPQEKIRKIIRDIFTRSEIRTNEVPAAEETFEIAGAKWKRHIHSADAPQVLAPEDFGTKTLADIFENSVNVDSLQPGSEPLTKEQLLAAVKNGTYRFFLKFNGLKYDAEFFKEAYERLKEAGLLDKPRGLMLMSSEYGDIDFVAANQYGFQVTSINPEVTAQSVTEMNLAALLEGHYRTLENLEKVTKPGENNTLESYIAGKKVTDAASAQVLLAYTMTELSQLKAKNEYARSGKWKNVRLDDTAPSHQIIGYDEMMPAERTAGIVGSGPVAEQLVRAFHAIGVKRILYAPGEGEADLPAKLTKELGIKFEKVSAEKLMQEAGVVVRVPGAKITELPAASDNEGQIIVDPAKLKVTKKAGENFLGESLKGKGLLVIGLKKEGMKISKIAISLGMDLLVFQPGSIEEENQEKKKQLDEMQRKWNGASAKPLEFGELNELMPKAYALTIHTEISSLDTTNFINADLFKAAANLRVVINTDAGHRIDEEALHEFLSQNGGRVAVLDVLKDETHPENSPVFKLPNALILGHTATKEPNTRRRMAGYMAENLKALLTGKTVPNPLNDVWPRWTISSERTEFEKYLEKILEGKTSMEEAYLKILAMHPDRIEETLQAKVDIKNLTSKLKADHKQDQFLALSKGPMGVMEEYTSRLTQNSLKESEESKVMIPGVAENQAYRVADLQYLHMQYYYDRYREGRLVGNAFKDMFLGYVARINRVIKAYRADAQEKMGPGINEVTADESYDVMIKAYRDMLKMIERDQDFSPVFTLPNMGLHDRVKSDDAEIIFTPIQHLVLRNTGFTGDRSSESWEEVLHPFPTPVNLDEKISIKPRYTNPVRNITVRVVGHRHPPYLVFEFSHPFPGYDSRFLRVAILKKPLPKEPSADETTDEFLRDGFEHRIEGPEGLGSLQISGDTSLEERTHIIERLREMAKKGLLLPQATYQLDKEESSHRLYAAAFARSPEEEQALYYSALYSRQDQGAKDERYEFAFKMGFWMFALQDETANSSLQRNQLARSNEVTMKKPLSKAVVEKRGFLAPIVQMFMAHDMQGEFLIPDSKGFKTLDSVEKFLKDAANYKLEEQVQKIVDEIQPGPEDDEETMRQFRGAVKVEILYRIFFELLGKGETTDSGILSKKNRPYIWLFLATYAESTWGVDLGYSRVGILARQSDFIKAMGKETINAIQSWKEFLLSDPSENHTSSAKEFLRIISVHDRRGLPAELPDTLKNLSEKNLLESIGKVNSNMSAQIQAFVRNLDSLKLREAIRARNREMAVRQKFYGDLVALREHYESGRYNQALELIASYADGNIYKLGEFEMPAEYQSMLAEMKEKILQAQKEVEAAVRQELYAHLRENKWGDALKTMRKMASIPENLRRSIVEQGASVRDEIEAGIRKDLMSGFDNVIASNIAMAILSWKKFSEYLGQPVNPVKLKLYEDLVTARRVAEQTNGRAGLEKFSKDKLPKQAKKIEEFYDTAWKALHDLSANLGFENKTPEGRMFRDFQNRMILHNLNLVENIRPLFDGVPSEELVNLAAFAVDATSLRFSYKTNKEGERIVDGDEIPKKELGRVFRDGFIERELYIRSHKLISELFYLYGQKDLANLYSKKYRDPEGVNELTLQSRILVDTEGFGEEKQEQYGAFLDGLKGAGFSRISRGIRETWDTDTKITDRILIIAGSAKNGRGSLEEAYRAKRLHRLLQVFHYDVETGLISHINLKDQKSRDKNAELTREVFLAPEQLTYQGFAEILRDRLEIPAPEKTEASAAKETTSPAVSEEPEDEEQSEEHLKGIRNLLSIYETALQATVDYETAVMETHGSIKFSQPPVSGRRESGRPYLLFRNLDNSDGLRLRPEQKIKITAADGTEYPAEVGSFVNGELEVYFRGVQPQASALHSGTIVKAAIDITEKSQMEFIHDLLSEKPVSKLVLSALGLEKPHKTPEEEKKKWISLNDERLADYPNQLAVVERALNGNDVELVWGPPGTGKTTVAAEVIVQNYRNHHSQVVMAHTNQAVDNLLILAKQAGLKVYRMGSSPDNFDPELRENWIYANEPKRPREPKNVSTQGEYAQYQRELETYKQARREWFRNLYWEIRSGRAVIGGTITGISNNKLLQQIAKYHLEKTGEEFHFERGVIEEASVAPFTQSLLALSKISGKALVVGDHYQLGLDPIFGGFKTYLEQLGFEEEHMPWLEQSLYSYLMNEGKHNVTMLTDNFRSPEILVKLMNTLYRDLAARKKVPAEVNKLGLVVVDTYLLGDQEEQEGTSWKNEQEVGLIGGLLEKIGDRINASSVGIVTPYGAQIDVLRDEVMALLEENENDSKLQERMAKILSNIGTAWPFQGRELPLMIASTVRSNEPKNGLISGPEAKTGFITWNMLNVMLSRAQTSTVVFINSKTFSASQKELVGDITDDLVDLAKREGTYVELKPKQVSEQMGKLAQSLKPVLEYIDQEDRRDHRSSLKLLPPKITAPKPPKVQPAAAQPAPEVIPQIDVHRHGTDEVRMKLLETPAVAEDPALGRVIRASAIPFESLDETEQFANWMEDVSHKALHEGKGARRDSGLDWKRILTSGDHETYVLVDSDGNPASFLVSQTGSEQQEPQVISFGSLKQGAEDFLRSTFAAEARHEIRILSLFVRTGLKKALRESPALAESPEYGNVLRLRDLQLNTEQRKVLNHSLEKIWAETVKTIMPDFALISKSGGNEVFILTDKKGRPEGVLVSSEFNQPEVVMTGIGVLGQRRGKGSFLMDAFFRELQKRDPEVTGEKVSWLDTSSGKIFYQKYLNSRGIPFENLPGNITYTVYMEALRKINPPSGEERSEIRTESSEKWREALSKAPVLARTKGLGRIIQASEIPFQDTGDVYAFGAYFAKVYAEVFKDRSQNAYNTAYEWRRKMTSKWYDFFILVDDSQNVTGFVVSKKGNPEAVYMERFGATEDGVRGRGTFLLDTYFNFLKGRNYKKVTWQVQIDNPAYDFYTHYLDRNGYSYEAPVESPVLFTVTLTEKTAGKTKPREGAKKRSEIRAVDPVTVGLIAAAAGVGYYLLRNKPWRAILISDYKERIQGFYGIQKKYKKEVTSKTTRDEILNLRGDLMKEYKKQFAWKASGILSTPLLEMLAKEYKNQLEYDLDIKFAVLERRALVWRGFHVKKDDKNWPWIPLFIEKIRTDLPHALWTGIQKVPSFLRSLPGKLSDWNAARKQRKAAAKQTVPPVIPPAPSAAAPQTVSTSGTLGENQTVAPQTPVSQDKVAASLAAFSVQMVPVISAAKLAVKRKQSARGMQTALDELNQSIDVLILALSRGYDLTEDEAAAFGTQARAQQALTEQTEIMRQAVESFTNKEKTAREAEVNRWLTRWKKELEDSSRVLLEQHRAEVTENTAQVPDPESERTRYQAEMLAKLDPKNQYRLTAEEKGLFETSLTVSAEALQTNMETHNRIKRETGRRNRLEQWKQNVTAEKENFYTGYQAQVTEHPEILPEVEAEVQRYRTHLESNLNITAGPYGYSADEIQPFNEASASAVNEYKGKLETYAAAVTEAKAAVRGIDERKDALIKEIAEKKGAVLQSIPEVRSTFERELGELQRAAVTTFKTNADRTSVTAVNEAASSAVRTFETQSEDIELLAGEEWDKKKNPFITEMTATVQAFSDETQQAQTTHQSHEAPIPSWIQTAADEAKKSVETSFQEAKTEIETQIRAAWNEMFTPLKDAMEPEFAAVRAEAQAAEDEVKRQISEMAIEETVRPAFDNLEEILQRQASDLPTIGAIENYKPVQRFLTLLSEQPLTQQHRESWNRKMARLYWEIRLLKLQKDLERTRRQKGAAESLIAKLREEWKVETRLSHKDRVELTRDFSQWLPAEPKPASAPKPQTTVPAQAAVPVSQVPAPQAGPKKMSSADYNRILREADALRRSKRDREAIPLYEQVAIDDNASSNIRSRAFLGAGISLANIKDYETALNYLEHALELDPQNIYLMTQRAWTLQFWGRELRKKQREDLAPEKFGKAFEQAEEVLNIEPENEAALKVKIAAMIEVRPRAEAAAYIEEVLERHPEMDLSKQRERLSEKRHEIRMDYSDVVKKLFADAGVEFKDGEEIRTDVGLFRPALDIWVDRLVTRVPSTGKIKIIDMGSGQGGVVFAFAKANSDAEVLGIEYDQKLYDDSVKVLADAENRPLSRNLKGRVRFEKGDFNDLKYAVEIAQADFIYYWETGGDDEKLLQTLSKSMKSGAKLIFIKNNGRFLNAVSRSEYFAPVQGIPRENEIFVFERNAVGYEPRAEVRMAAKIDYKLYSDLSADERNHADILLMRKQFWGDTNSGKWDGTRRSNALVAYDRTSGQPMGIISFMTSQKRKGAVITGTYRNPNYQELVMVGHKLQDGLIAHLISQGYESLAAGTALLSIPKERAPQKLYRRFLGKPGVAVAFYEDDEKFIKSVSIDLKQYFLERQNIDEAEGVFAKSAHEKIRAEIRTRPSGLREIDNILKNPGASLRLVRVVLDRVQTGKIQPEDIEFAKYFRFLLGGRADDIPSLAPLGEAVSILHHADPSVPWLSSQFPESQVAAFLDLQKFRPLLSRIASDNFNTRQEALKELIATARKTAPRAIDEKLWKDIEKVLLEQEIYNRAISPPGLWTDTRYVRTNDPIVMPVVFLLWLVMNCPRNAFRVYQEVEEELIAETVRIEKIENPETLSRSSSDYSPSFVNDRLRRFPEFDYLPGWKPSRLPNNDLDPKGVFNSKYAAEAESRNIPFKMIHDQVLDSTIREAARFERLSGLFTVDFRRNAKLAYRDQVNRLTIKVSWLWRKKFEEILRIFLGLHSTLWNASMPSEIETYISDAAAYLYPYTQWPEPTEEEIAVAAVWLQRPEEEIEEEARQYIANLWRVSQWLRNASAEEAQTEKVAPFDPEEAAQQFEDLALRLADTPADAKDFGFSQPAMGLIYAHALKKIEAQSRPEIRSKEEAKLFEVFGDQEGARVRYQAQWIAKIFDQLSASGKRTALYPNLLMTLLGVKPFYYQTEQDSPHPKDLILEMNSKNLLEGSRLNFYVDERRLYSLLHTAVKLLQSRRFFELKGLLQSEDAAVLDQMDSMFRNSGDKGEIYRLTQSLVDKITERIEKAQGAPEIKEQLHFFFGTLFDHSVEDMEAYWAAIQTGRPALNDPRFKSAGYYATSIFTPRPEQQNRWLRRAQASLDYAYSLLAGKSGFEVASRDYRAVRPEIRSVSDRKDRGQIFYQNVQEFKRKQEKFAELVADILKPLAGKKSVTRAELLEILTARQEEIFASQRSLKETANQMAVYADYDDGFVMYQTLNIIDSPDCGLCRESADAVIEGIQKSGLGKVLRPQPMQFRDGFNVLHKYVMVETAEGFTAIDIASGQMRDEPKSVIRVEPFTEYSAAVTASILNPSPKKIKDVKSRAPIVSEQFETLRQDSFRSEIRSAEEEAFRQQAMIEQNPVDQYLRNLLLSNPSSWAKWFEGERKLAARLEFFKPMWSDRSTVKDPFPFQLAIARMHFRDQYGVQSLGYFSELAEGIMPLDTPQNKTKAIEVLIKIDDLLRRRPEAGAALRLLKGRNFGFVLAKKLTNHETTGAWKNFIDPGLEGRSLLAIPVISQDEEGAPINYDAPVDSKLSIDVEDRSFVFLDRVFLHELAHAFWGKVDASGQNFFRLPLKLDSARRFLAAHAAELKIVVQGELSDAQFPVVAAIMGEKIYQKHIQDILQTLGRPSNASVQLGPDDPLISKHFLSHRSGHAALEFLVEGLSLFWMDPQLVREKDPLLYEFFNAIYDWSPVLNARRHEIRSAEFSIREISFDSLSEGQSRTIIKSMVAVNNDSGWDFSQLNEDLKSESYPGGVVFKAVDRKNKTIGYGWLTPLESGKDAGFYLIAVRKEWQGKGRGVAQALMERIFKYLEQHHIKEAWAAIDIENEKSLRFFDRQIKAGRLEILHVHHSMAQKEKHLQGTTLMGIRQQYMDQEDTELQKGDLMVDFRVLPRHEIRTSEPDNERRFLAETEQHGEVLQYGDAGVLLLGKNRAGKSAIAAILAGDKASIYREALASNPWKLAVANLGKIQFVRDGNQYKLIGMSSSDPLLAKWALKSRLIGKTKLYGNGNPVQIKYAIFLGSENEYLLAYPVPQAMSTHGVTLDSMGIRKLVIPSQEDTADPSAIPLSYYESVAAQIRQFVESHEARPEIRTQSHSPQHSKLLQIFAEDPSAHGQYLAMRESLQSLLIYVKRSQSVLRQARSGVTAGPWRGQFLRYFDPVQEAMNELLEAGIEKFAGTELGIQFEQVRQQVVDDGLEFSRMPLRPEIRKIIEVAKEMTARILPVSQAEALIDLILPAALAQEAVERLTAEEKDILINYYTVLFRSGGKAVLPAEALQTLESGNSLFDYFDLILKGAKQANQKSPVVYVAGQGSQEIKNRVFSAEHFRLNPKFVIDGPKIFSFSPQSEVVVAERLKRESLAVSFAKEPEEKITASIPAFLLDQDALKELSASDRLEYLSRLTQLQLLAAEQLKNPAQEMPAFLAKAGIEFELSAGGFVRPSAQSLLSEKFTQLMASQLSQQSA